MRGRYYVNTVIPQTLLQYKQFVSDATSAQLQNNAVTNYCSQNGVQKLRKVNNLNKQDLP